MNHNSSDGAYKQNLKEHILANDITHLYGTHPGTQQETMYDK